MNEKFLIKKSKIHENGVFASQDIKAGTCFYEIPMDITSKRPKPDWARIGDKYVGDDKLLNFLNHSCDPNAEIVLTPKPCLKAISDIKKDEEITCDYNKTEINGKRYSCNCQNKKCRGYFLAEK